MYVLDLLKYLAAKHRRDSEAGVNFKRLAAEAHQTLSRERQSNRIFSPDESPASSEGESGTIVKGFSGEYRIGGRADLSVFKAIHTETHQRVVLRLFADPHHNGHVTSVSDALVIRRTPHPAIAMVLEEGNVDAGHYIIREFVEGPSLQRVIDERGRLSTQECVDLAAQLAEVLEVSHRRGTTHGRLSASNVFIEPSGTIKVTDWNERAQNEAPGDFETAKMSDLRTLGALLTASWPVLLSTTARNRHRRRRKPSATCSRACCRIFGLQPTRKSSLNRRLRHCRTCWKSLGSGGVLRFPACRMLPTRRCSPI
jgi:hypothetical protein